VSELQAYIILFGNEQLFMVKRKKSNNRQDKNEKK